MWEIEEIPDESSVFTRIHKHDVSSQDGKPKKTAFLNTPEEGEDLSCDWNKYHNEYQSLEQIGKEKNQRTGKYKDKTNFFIYALSVLELRKIDSPVQKVKHNPVFNNPEIEGVPNNRAHSGIFGSKSNDAKFRTKVLRCGQWSAICPAKDPELEMLDIFIAKVIPLKLEEVIEECKVALKEKADIQKSKFLNFISNLYKLLNNTYKVGGISPELFQKAEPILDGLINKGEIDPKIKEIIFK